MIDPSVNERVDAYRGNPQGLMQKYSQNANLIDLLALQKLKDEKTAAIREMQLKMARNGTPPTIGQQREQEVLALTKDEIAKQQADLTNQGQQQQVQQ
jgi:predicted GIY-YIG superfamily endonuclease